MNSSSKQVNGNASTYKIENFYKINKIDAHIHILHDANKFLKSAQEINFQLISINADVPYYPYPPLEEQQEIIKSHQKEFPGMLNYVTTFSMKNWDSPDWVKETLDYLKYSFENGAVAVKVWKNIGMEIKDKDGKFIQIDNPKFDPIFDFLSENNIPLLGHIGEPKNCWLPVEKMTVNNDKNYFKNHPEYHMYLHPEYPSYEEIINSRNNMLEKHPDLKFIGCHLASLEWSVDVIAEHFDKYPNMVVDLAERICHLQYQSKLDRQKVRDFLIKYQDRIIYGTDLEIVKEDDPNQYIEAIQTKWLSDWKYFASEEEMEVEEVDGAFNGLSLPKEVIDKIYFHNAKNWILRS